jgi:hypothetical protein
MGPSANYNEAVRFLHYVQDITRNGSKVFIAIDVEWDETDSSNILEIGLATLDLREGHYNPAAFPPSTWRIHPRHIIISENHHINNYRYITSNKFGFKFGGSYHARLETAMSSIEGQLSAYEAWEMVFIGHGIHQDLKVLEEATGARIEGNSPVVDTMKLERAYSRRVNGKSRSLGDICEDLDIRYYAPEKMHNAGNDAFFTMAIFIEMCCLPD